MLEYFEYKTKKCVLLPRNSKIINSVVQALNYLTLVTTSLSKSVS